MEFDLNVTAQTFSQSSAHPQAVWPFVSVIVPVFNGAETIEQLLEALKAQNYPAERREFIIADDASSDSTPTILARYADVCRIVVCADNLGSYNARNRAVELARGDVFAFTDADCRPDPNWLVEGVRALMRQGGGLVAGAVTITPTCRASAIQRYDAFFGIQQAFFARKLRFGATANLFAGRSALELIGGFDAGLRSGGDRKFCQIGVQRGLDFSYSPASIVRHLPRTSFAELARKQIRISIGQVHIFPRWSRLYVLPLRARDPEIFDAQALVAESLGFRLRFVCVYYALEVLHVLTYGWGCLTRLRKLARG
jgi:hypothetical protein